MTTHRTVEAGGLHLAAHHPGLTVLILAPVVAALCATLAHHRLNRSSATVARWGRRSRRQAGTASTWAILRRGSWLAMRYKMRAVRPSTREMGFLQRLQVPAVACAIPLARIGLLRLWASIEDVVTVFGGPRTGKSGWLAGRIIDAPGACLVTSTRLDLHELTSPLRSRNARPVYVFNPVGLGDLVSTVTFDPLTGCTDPTSAAERAADMISAVSGGQDSGEREFWAGQARRVLAALMHAAAQGGLTMEDVQGWIADPDSERGHVGRLLRDSPAGAAAAKDAAQFLGTNDKTRSSITSTIMPALAWMTSPAAAAAAVPGGTPFDVAEMIRCRATVYLLGAEETHSAPLVAALTGHIAREARRIAARQASGRLDPPLTMALDEAALICPVPLESWTADMGGRGVSILIALQSRAQLINRWGQAGAAVILNNSGTVMLFGGTKDREDLDHWTTLAGDRDEPVETRDAAGKVTSTSVRKTPVLTGAQLANLPPQRVVIFRRGLPVAVGRVRMAWRRHDVRAAQRAIRRAAAAVLSEAAELVHAERHDREQEQTGQAAPAGTDG